MIGRDLPIVYIMALSLVLGTRTTRDLLVYSYDILVKPGPFLLSSKPKPTFKTSSLELKDSVLIGRMQTGREATRGSSILYAYGQEECMLIKAHRTYFLSGQQYTTYPDLAHLSVEPSLGRLLSWF
ncbi:hypothetical protein VNO77_19304 [Canavalia gladiata]|uniref:Uncharacterized protein n=1 Tax=Canavalia gladiata TaxID=3824 RepID=A0AAN9LQQ2_CANGL